MITKTVPLYNFKTFIFSEPLNLNVQFHHFILENILDK